MQIIQRSSDLHALAGDLLGQRRRIALVPTMGNLHAGHHSLISLARKHADIVIASVFVNPTQFGPSEDFARYPRTPQADAAGLEASGCDVLFMPPVEDVYPYGIDRSVRVSVPELPDVLEGAIRPGHFDGVATVVAKLFNLVRPHLAVFGQKDYQQLLLIRRMTRDLGYPIEILAAPIMREANGLAMSSRNQYLSADERVRAGIIHLTLLWMAAQAQSRRASRDEIEQGALARLRDSDLAPDYAVLRRADDLLEPTEGERHQVALIAAKLGTTRLIDNFLVDL